MAKEKTLISHTWMGKPIAHPSHHHDLEQMAAIHEFGNAKPDDMSPEEWRRTAEDSAFSKYTTEHTRRAAAHSLAGKKAAQAVGNLKAAAMHHADYENTMRELGHNPSGPVPPEVKMYESPEYHMVYDYKPHPAMDHIRSGAWKKGKPPIKKSVSDFLREALEILKKA
jgi:hypothetical protein